MSQNHALDPRPTGLQLQEDIPFQRREWMLQRGAWVLMALTILGGLLGLFGGGPLSRSSAVALDHSLSLEYDRIIHFHAPACLRVSVAGGLVRENTLRIWLSADYLEATQLKQVIPEPARIEAGADGHTFVFHAATDGRPITVTFHLEANEVGNLAGQIKVVGGQAVDFLQFVYP